MAQSSMTSPPGPRSPLPPRSPSLDRRSPTTSARLAAPVSQGGAGAKLIVDDVIYFEEPFFQDGPIAAAVNEVSAAGVYYFSSAGNNNLIDSEGQQGRLLGSPLAFATSGLPTGTDSAPERPKSCMDFDPDPGADDPMF